MKTYILRDPKTVEPQKSLRPPRGQPIAAAVPAGRRLFIGLDVHNDTIAVSLAPAEGTEVRRYGIIGGGFHGGDGEELRAEDGDQDATDIVPGGGWGGVTGSSQLCS